MLDLSAPKVITFIASVVIALAAVVIHYHISQFRLAALASPFYWWLIQCLLPGMCSETFRVASFAQRLGRRPKPTPLNPTCPRVKQAAWIAAITAGKS